MMLDRICWQNLCLEFQPKAWSDKESKVVDGVLSTHDTKR